MDNSSIGKKIKRLRDGKAWTQEHLADAARISVRTVQRAEEGVLSAETLSAIAGALDVPVQELSVRAKPPAGWPRISPAIFYDDAETAIEFLVKAFGFEVRLKVPGPGHSIMHSELTYEDGVIMVASSRDQPPRKSPRALGGISQSLYIFVDDVDAHYERAKAAGAKILGEPMTSHGNKQYFVEDAEGHHWGFAEHVGGH